MGKFVVGLVASSVVGLLLVGCSSHEAASSSVADGDPYSWSGYHGYRVLKSGRGGYAGYGRLIKQGRGGYYTAPHSLTRRPGQDGPPDWVEDVTRMPDAVPEVLTGPVKAEPYTVLGKRYYPIQDAANYWAVGIASWYGTKFHGQKTANGEDYDLYGMTAAHKTLPLPCFVRVTNLDNGRSVVVRVNDRGPFHSDRVIDLSYAAAVKLGYANIGTARVSVEGIDPVRWQAEHGKHLSPKTQIAKAKPVRSFASAYSADGQRAASLLAGHEPISSSYSHRVPTKRAGDVWVGKGVVFSQSYSSSSRVNMSPRGMYLQVGAYASATAAEAVKNRLRQSTSMEVVVDSVQRDQKTLHRVRIGPLHDTNEAYRLQNTLRLANLGQATLVQAR